MHVEILVTIDASLKRTSLLGELLIMLDGKHVKRRGKEETTDLNDEKWGSKQNEKETSTGHAFSEQSTTLTRLKGESGKEAESVRNRVALS